MKQRLLFLVCSLFLTMTLGAVETGTEKAQQTGTRNETFTGVCYSVDGTFIAGTGNKQFGTMSNCGMKLRTNMDGNRIVFTVVEGYAIHELRMEALSNYDYKEGITEGPCISVKKVEVDGTEITYSGGDFPAYTMESTDILSVSGINAKSTIAIYFDNSNAAGSQIGAYFELDWEKLESTVPLNTKVTPTEAAIAVGESTSLTGEFIGGNFEGEWKSSNTAVATVNANGVVTGLSSGSVDIIYCWTNDESYFAKATITVNDRPTLTTISPSTATIAVNRAVKFSGGFEGGNFDGEWISSNTKVATVTEDGTVRGIAPGTIFVTYQCKNTNGEPTSKAMARLTVVKGYNLDTLQVVKKYDFENMGETALTIQTTSAGKIWNAANDRNMDVYFCTNEGLENLAISGVLDSNNRGWSVYPSGLYVGSTAGRPAAVAGIKKGQIVRFYHSGGDFFTKNDGSDDGVKKVEVESSYSYHSYLALEDGMMGFELSRGNRVYSISILEEPIKFTAQTVEGVDMTFVITDKEAKTCQVGVGNTAAIYSYTEGGVTIPQKVTFSGTEYSVTSIGNKAFQYCHNITEIVIPEGVTTIGSQTFYSCENLASLVIPSSVTNIGNNAFRYCTSLTNVTVADGNSVFDSREGCNAIIETASNTLLWASKSTVIPSSVTAIGSYAYYGNGVKNIIIPEGVKTIENDAFYNSGATSITLPSTVTSIGRWAFGFCDDLDNVYCHANPENLSWEGNDNKSSFKSGAFAKNITNYQFQKWKGISTDATTSSESAYFLNNIGSEQNAGDVIWGDPTVQYLNYANISGSQDIVIEGTPGIQLRILLNRLEVGNGGGDDYGGSWTEKNTVIGEDGSAKVNLQGMSMIRLNAIKFGWDSPSGTITRIYLNNPNAATHFHVYNETDWVEKYPNANVVFVGDIAKYDASVYVDGLCYYLEEGSNQAQVVQNSAELYSGDIIIPNKIVFNDVTYDVTSIGDGAFVGCNNLTSVTIPASITTIGERAFYDLDNLKTVTSLMTEPSAISYSVFKTGQLIFVPVGTKNLYTTTDGWNAFRIYEEGEQIPYTVGTKFSATTEEGVLMQFVVLDTDNKTCQVGDGNNTAIDRLTKGKVTIPSSVNGYSVIAIGSYSFANCDSIISLVIPEGISSIGNRAFYHCDSLKDVSLPNNLLSIGDYAFAYCYGLSNILFPASITTIGYRAFYYAGLTTVTSLVENPFDCGNYAFYLRKNPTLYVPAGTKAAYKEKTGWSDFVDIREIGVEPTYTDGEIFFAETEEGVRMTFKVLSSENKTCQVGDGKNRAIDNSNFGTVTIPASVNGFTVTNIGYRAFYESYYSTNFSIPTTVTNIGEYAFYSSNITSVTSLIEEPFDCNSNTFSVGTFTTLYVPAGTKASYKEKNGWSMFGYIQEIGVEPSYDDGEVFYAETEEGVLMVFKVLSTESKTCQVGDGNNRAINYYTSGTVTIPASVNGFTVTGIGNGAFYYCSNLTDITIPATVSNIGEYAFYASYATSVTSLITEPFDCNSNTFSVGTFTTLYVPAGTKASYKEKNGWSMFGNIQEIGVEPSYDNGELFYAETEEGVLMVFKVLSTENMTCQVGDGNNRAIDYSTSSTVTIPASVNGFTVINIGSHAFYNNSISDKLTSITIPATVTNIDNYAIRNCSGLTSISVDSGNTVYDSRGDCQAIIETASNNLIVGCQNTVIPETVTSINSYAFYNCPMTSINIPAGVTSIGNDAFYGCNGMTSISVEDGNTIYDSRGGCNALIETASNKLIIGCKNTVIPESVTIIENNAFYRCAGLKTITIPASVTSIGNYAFYNCNDLEAVYAKSSSPAQKGYDYYSRTTLYVPRGTVTAYKSAWTGFRDYIEYGDAILDVDETGQGTYCCSADLDFSAVEGMKAYAATQYVKSSGVVIMTRLTDVPAGTGVYVKGTPGSYVIPTTTSTLYCTNLLKGFYASTSVSAFDGDMANYVLSSETNSFVRLMETINISTNCAILQLPTTYMNGGASRSIRMLFDDEDATAIEALLNDVGESDEIYDLQGRKVNNPQRGLFIKNGNKIMKK